eukprot:838318-Pyramimonas_sp.AAC.1
MFAASTACSWNSSGWDRLVLTHRADVLRRWVLFSDSFWVLRTSCGRPTGMPGRSVPAQGGHARP